MRHSPIADRDYGAVLCLRDPGEFQLELFYRDNHPQPPATTDQEDSTMTTSNVDVVKSICSAFAAGDIDDVLATMDPEIVWMTPATLPWSTGDYHGTGGAAAYFTSFAAALTTPAIVPQEFLDAGDHVIVPGEERATAAATGRSFVAWFTHTWTLQDRRVILACARSSLLDTDPRNRRRGGVVGRSSRPGRWPRPGDRP